MANRKENLKSYLREGTPAAIIERYLALGDIASDSDFADLDDNVVVVDTEATGLSVKKDDLIQIAAAKIEKGKIVDWYITFVDPGIKISEEITHLTNISNDDIKGAPNPTDALNGLVDFCGDALMLAHNAVFDKSFLTKHAAGYPLLENIWADTLDLARIAFPRLNSHRLIDLAKAFSVQESTHRADDDVATTVEIYHLILAAISQMPYELIACIAGLASADMWSTSYVFKKMLEIVPQINQEDNDDQDDEFENLKSEVLQQSFFDDGQKNVNAFSMLRAMRMERFTSLSKQKKFDVELDPELIDVSADMQNIVADSAMQFPSEEALEDDFSKTGLLGKIYPDYEQRDEQITMSKHVLSSFRDSKNLVIEAGTGVGKSMAYLIPAIKIAKENKIIVGVATKTNSLLDQLIYHELPALAKEIDGLIYSSLKGARHYICLRKAASLAQSKARMVSFKEEKFCNAASIAGVLSFIEQSVYDDCDGMKINGRSLPNAAYTSSSHECLRRKCPFYHNGCFVHGARRMAQNSDIVVTNHSMLFCDIKANGSLMPPIRYWIVDEAHSADKEARRSFSHIISASVLLDIAKGLESESAKYNVFERAIRNIDVSDLESKEERGLDHGEEQSGKGLIFGLIKKCKNLGKDLSSHAYLYANNINLLLKQSSKNRSGYEFSTVWINNELRESQGFNELWKYAKNFNQAAENLITEANKLAIYLDDYKSCAIMQREISAFVVDIKELVDATDLIFFNNSDAYVYSANINNKKTVKQDRISAELYSVSEKLNTDFYANCKSIVMTSATLATGDSFKSFKDAMGLGREALQCQLSSSFDYDSNMVVYVCNDMPDPSTNMPYLDTLASFLSDLHVAGDGSILSLFTNRKQMEYVYDMAQDNFKEHNLRVLVQKWGLSVKGVKDEFLSNEKLSLFALKSFWEGFDAPGSTLKGVVICKLPFARVDDPLSQERKLRSDNAWFEFSLPECVIETKQAVGRLIRKADDKGYIVLADSRIVSKKYGKIFLDSMPTKNIKIMSCNEIVDDITRNNLYK